MWINAVVEDLKLRLAVCVSCFQAVNRQISLEQQLQTLKENEQALQTLQESLSQLDHTLTSYLTDRIDAFQLPQEAQVDCTSITCTLTSKGAARQEVTLGRKHRCLMDFI